VNITSFIQRDMDATPLGFAPYQTPFSDQAVKLEYGNKIGAFPIGTCGTGDSFAVDEDFGNGAYDVVDMEAYALALICKEQSIPFVCLKYISDGADGRADEDWSEALKTTSHALKTALEEHVL
jgi:adenosylhomocysteine nucleosidase